MILFLKSVYQHTDKTGCNHFWFLSVPKEQTLGKVTHMICQNTERLLLKLSWNYNLYKMLF